MNIAGWVSRNARGLPGHTALARGEAVHADWATFAGRVQAVAGALLGEYGCRPGDRAAIVMKNSCEYLEALFGIWHAGLVAVPVNAKLHPAEIAWILDHSGASVTFTDPGLADSVKATPMIVAPGGGWRRLTDGPAIALVDRRPEDPAWLFYTSGTTGRPKGATLTHRNLLLMSLSYFADIDPVAPTDAILHAAPLSHGSGLYGLPHVARGATNVVPDSGGVDAAEIAALLGRWPGLSFFAAPTIVGRLLAEPALGAAPLDHLKTIIYGGAPMYRADLDRALEVFGPRLVQIYGQGESPMTITALSKADHALERQAGAACGRPPGPTWRSGSSATTTASCRSARPARCVVRGDVVMAGYWNDPAATAEATARRLAAHRRRRQLRRGRVPDAAGPVEGRHHQRRQQHLSPRGRGGPPPPSRRAGGLGGRRPASRMGRGGRGLRRGRRPGRAAGHRGARPALPRSHRPLQAAQAVPVRRRAAQEQLRQGPQAGAAGRPVDLKRSIRAAAWQCHQRKPRIFGRAAVVDP